MIWVVGNIEGNQYKEPFSKGVLARSLRVSRLGLDQAYEIANEIEKELLERDINEISVNDLATYVADYLNNVDPEVSSKYKNWREVRKSDEPLIILIGGASGVGTSSMAFELANRLGLKNIISTDMIREVMRKIVSKDLNPVIHKSSFDAYESIRTPAIRVDAVIEGFISHVDVVNVGVEAIIERSLKEGISVIIEGVHVVPGFIREDLIKKDNVIMLILTVDDEETHKQRFYTRCRPPWVKRSLEHYMENFETIRKTQQFLVDQAKIHNTHVINNVDFRTTIDSMVNEIIKEFGGENDGNEESGTDND
ncbi:2-phosphoglycerate kinase [Methanobrevibacter millerae]|uniref:2-phosphoglycerate kinase n=1 Tax=Methanobrevibacter millerae TaxID=230361 RepID=A0A1G5UYP5_9EURY|nr:2-phosphoglycerate kinase [Methanobrevibacter millerae]SDA37885.1 2-phosphoglycerate kinase [Methanobrevibacter millerae]